MLNYTTGKHYKAGRPRWGQDQPHIYHKISGKTWEAWATNAGDGWQNWCIADEGYTVAYVKIKSETHRREDVTGYKAFRMSRETRYAVSWRYGHDRMASTELFYGHKGEVATVRDVIQWIAKEVSTLHMHIRFELERQCRDAGLDDRAIFNCWDTDNERHNLNLCRLMQRHKEATNG